MSYKLFCVCACVVNKVYFRKIGKIGVWCITRLEAMISVHIVTHTDTCVAVLCTLFCILILEINTFKIW